MKIRNIISVFLAAAVTSGTFASAAVTEVKVNYPFGTLTRQMEALGRGLVAIRTGDGIYLSWRLLSDEDTRFGTGSENVTFEVYRDGEQIDIEENTTNYLDRDGTAKSKYYVVSSNGDISATVSAFASGSNYFDIDLERPARSAYGAYTINDVSTGDLDGDGEYELVVKWDSNGKDNSQSGITGEVIIDAYKLNGERLWSEPIKLGKNIRAGAHYTQFLVYDFDLDGKSEITIKTAPGSKDGNGNYVTDASEIEDIQGVDNDADYRNSSGYVLDGDEYFTIFDGETGAALDTIYYPVQRISAAVWGDDNGNRVDRFIADVSWLDGEKPYAVYWRGYYYGRNGKQRTGICAMSFDGEHLSADYCFDTYNTEKESDYKGVHGYTKGNDIYVGQGNHNMTTADVDGDGKDEFISGALCMEVDDNNKLMPKWCSFREHGDALHIGAYDPTRKYVYFSVHEDGGYQNSQGKMLDFGMTLYDADTGEELLHRGNNDDTGRGMMANVGAGGYFQFWGAGSYMSKGNNEYTDAVISGTSSNFRIFWDGDLYDELLDGTSVTSWNGSTMSRIFQASGCTAINGTKNNPALQADILGDWREEVIYPKSDNTALRVYVSDIPTDYKIMTLMHDSVYRSGVAAEQTAYNQPPHIGFYMDEVDFSGPVTGIKVISQPDIIKYNIGDALNTKGLVVSLVYENGKEIPTNDYDVSGYDAYNSGVQTLTVTYGEFSTEFKVTVVSGFIAENGVITGYNNDAASDTTVILPERVDGIPVTGFADGSMKGSGVTHLYIYDNTLTFDGDVFDNTITVHGYEGSTAQAYCEEHEIPFSAMVTNVSYMADEDYAGEEFDGFVGGLGKHGDYYSFDGNFIVTQPGDVLVSKTINGIIYGNNARTDAYPDLTTGIKAGRDDAGNKYLVPIAGEFSTGGRNSWLEIEEKVDLSTVSEYTFSFDILYPTDCGMLILTLSDGKGTVDTVLKANNMEYDTWYTYTYHYYDDNRLTRTISKGFEVIDTKDLGVSSSSYGISKIDFTRDTTGTYPSTLWGGWNNHGEGRTALAYMDNIQVYTPERAAAEFTVTDSYGLPIEGARIAMAGATQYTDENGVTAIVAENGTYQATISADGYYSKVVEVALREGRENVAVTLEALPLTAEDIAFDRESITITVGGYDLAKYSVTPESADYGIEFSSSDTAVVTIDENGIIKGIAPGTAKITASRDDILAECNVTVIESADGVPASIVLVGDDTYIPNPLSGSSVSVDVSASVYDVNGIELYSVPVTFDVTGAAVTEEYYNGIGVVPDGGSNVVITAKAGDVSAQKTIKVEKSDITENAYSSFDDSLRMLQGKEAQSQKLEGTGITLNVGNRSGGGDGRTGFIMENGVLKAQTGNFNTASRNAYITFDNPSTTSDGEFMFETKLTFATGDEATVKISDGSSDVVKLSPSSGFAAGVEYLYRIMYTSGEYIQSITNTKTGETVKSQLYTSAKGISRIDIVNDDQKSTAVTFDDMRIISSPSSIMTRATVYVYDENGSPVEGAIIETPSSTVETASNGRATFDCYTGVNEIAVSYDGISVSKKANISDSNALINIKLYGSEIKLIGTDSPVYFVRNVDFIRFIKGEYNNGALTGVKITEASFSNRKTLVEIKSDSTEYKVFIWNDNMEPLMEVFAK